MPAHIACHLDPRDVALTQRPVERATMLPPAAFVDPDVLEWELDQLFRGWICVGHVSAVDEPGKFVMRELGADSVVVIGGEDGTPARLPQRLPPPRRAASSRSLRAACASGCAARTTPGRTSSTGELRAAPHMDGVEDFDFSC